MDVVELESEQDQLESLEIRDLEAQFVVDRLSELQNGHKRGSTS